MINFLYSLLNAAPLKQLHVCVTDTPGKIGGPIRFTNITEEKATLWWEPPANDGCAAITHYVIEKRETSRVSWALIEDHCEACSYTALRLIKGNEYQFRISAANKFGVGRPLESDPFVAQAHYSKFIINRKLQCVCAS